MDKIELANMVNGALGRRTSQDSASTVGRTRTYSGVATSDSDAGKVFVTIDGDSITQDGSQAVIMDTTVAVKSGQKVIVTVVNGTPTVTGVVGWGDSVEETIETAISGVDVEYAQNQSTTVAPTTGWDTTAPTWREGYYIWQRTATTTKEGTTYSTPTCISGADGQDGQPGATGKGVSAIVEQYYLSTSDTTQTGGSWGTSQPAWVSGKYIWTRSHITWTDNTTTNTSPVLAQAINGANQSAADAAKTATNYLHFDSSGLAVGVKTNNVLGNNVLIKSTGIDIRNGSTVLGSYEANAVDLGTNSQSSVIRMCGQKGRVRYDTSDRVMAMYADQGAILSAGQADDSALTGYMGIQMGGLQAIVFTNKFFVTAMCSSNCSDPITINSTYRIYAYRNQFGMVTVVSNGSVAIPAGERWLHTTFGTLPEGYRPRLEVLSPVTYCGGAHGYLSVNTAGEVEYVRIEEQSIADGLYVSMSFAAVNPSAI